MRYFIAGIIALLCIIIMYIIALIPVPHTCSNPSLPSEVMEEFGIHSMYKGLCIVDVNDIKTPEQVQTLKEFCNFIKWVE